MPKPRRVQQSPSDPDLPPGYVQSLIRRVINNVNIVVNNLILKYVEDDIVLSVNITSAECYTVDELWDRAFMDISTPELVLRKVINFADCTVCLDKRNASGKIEVYQEPLLYKCSFTTRLHFTHHNINSKIPAVIKIQTMVESLKLSLTDQQLPMFVRVLELAVSLYYGEFGVHSEQERDESTSVPETTLNVPGVAGEGVDPAAPTPYPITEQYMQTEDEEQGWVSWAWSFVPALVSPDREDGEEDFFMEKEEGGTPSSTQPSFREPIVSVGLYCTKAIVTFKVRTHTSSSLSSESSYYSPQKVKSREVLCVEQEGITVEALMMGETFFDCQIGVVGCRALCLKSIMGVRDFEENLGRIEDDAVFFRCGDSLSSKGMTYLTNSLFDYRSPENNGVRAEFILDGDLHKETYSESAGLQRFGAFYLDYLYTMETASGKGTGPRPPSLAVYSSFSSLPSSLFSASSTLFLFFSTCHGCLSDKRSFVCERERVCVSGTVTLLA
ncbi:intermembrane lipid transfer protein VPS13B-like [Brachyhypopomus gauderio]|uniref:intermembrane lipid transfer protein VPS13B-like n=1 Tax=Brachyhypopomus gauderio TaxID=698409 RepID=UPI0040437F45